jgi:hypothetical protein
MSFLIIPPKITKSLKFFQRRYNAALNEASREQARQRGKSPYSKEQIEAFDAGFKAGCEAKADEIHGEMLKEEIESMEYPEPLNSRS